LRNLVGSLALELEPKGIRIATVTIFGFVKPGTPFSPERIAEEFFALSQEAPGSRTSDSSAADARLGIANSRIRA
jgi:hypothetical protein